MKLSLWKLLFLLLPVLSLHAQDFPLTPLSPSSWESKHQGWKEIESITIHPFEDKIDMNSGQGILYAQGKASLTSQKKFGSFKLAFEFLQSDETEASLRLGNALKVNLSNSNASNNRKLGAVIDSKGNFNNPLQNVCKATGLWQKVEMTYSASSGNRPAIIDKLTINGVLIFENYFLEDSGFQEPVHFDLFKGVLALKNVSYTTLGNKKPVSVSNLTYQLQQTSGGNKSFEKADSAPISGKSDVITHQIPNDYRYYILNYKGDLNVETEGLYAFTLDYQGVVQFKIDGKQVAGSDKRSFRIPETKLIELSVGTHSFEYSYQRIWWGPGFGLFVSGADFKSYALHAPKNLPMQDLVDGIFINPEGAKAKTIRSFMNFKDTKRTKVISVATPQMKHYSFDLEDGSLLYAWKGKFADVTEMWHARGEPQLLETLGQKIVLSGKPSFFKNTTDSTIFEEYYLDNDGIPTYLHTLNGAMVSQKMAPVKNGLAFTVSAENNEISYLLAESENIEKLSPTLYKTNDYYVQLANPVGLKLEKKGDMMQLSGVANKIESYTLIW